jgi:hypothetical protein
MSLKSKVILKWNGIVENSTTPQKQQSGQRTTYNSSSKNSSPSSPSEQQVYTVGEIARLSTLMVETQQVLE